MIDKYGYVVNESFHNGAWIPEDLGDSCFFTAILMEISIINGDYKYALELFEKIVIQANCIRHPEKNEYQRDGVKKINQILWAYPEFRSKVEHKYAFNASKLPLGEHLGIGKAQGIGPLKFFQLYPFMTDYSRFKDILWFLYSFFIMFQIILYEAFRKKDWMTGFFAIHLAFLDYDSVTEKHQNWLLVLGRFMINYILEALGHKNYYIQYRCGFKPEEPSYPSWNGCAYQPERDMRSFKENGQETNQDLLDRPNMKFHGLGKMMLEAIKCKMKNT